MAIHVEHELHRRRLGRNLGVGLVLMAVVVLLFGLTVVKVLALGDARAFEDFDHVVRPPLVVDPDAPAPVAAP